MTTLTVCLAALAIASLAGGLLLWARRRGDAALDRELAAQAEADLAELAAFEARVDAQASGFAAAVVSMRRFGRAVEDLALHTGSLRTWTPDEEEADR